MAFTQSANDGRKLRSPADMLFDVAGNMTERGSQSTEDGFWKLLVQTEGGHSRK
jgi:hypothetical protein